MPELGIPYVLTGPDGTRAVFNDPTDVDFVGYLDPEQGITGLLDTAQVRESSVDKVEGHGAFQGNNWLARRVGTMNGLIPPPASMATLNLIEAKIKRASRGLKNVSPSVLTWTPTGGVQRYMNLWRQGIVGFTGRRPKKFQIPLACPDSFVYSAALHAQVINPAGVGGEQGFTSPMVNPITSLITTAGQSFVVNAGDAESYPLFIIQGPLTNPTLLNNTTGQKWTLTYTLSASDILVVDSYKRSVNLYVPLTFGDPVNLVTNPNFEVDISGWSSWAAGTPSRSTVDQPYLGGACLKVVTPGTGANNGAVFQDPTGTPPSYTAGQIYTAALWLRASTGTVNLTLSFGSSANHSLLNIAIGTSWTRVPITWTPLSTTSGNIVQLAIYTQGAGATTFFVDAAMVVKGNILPDYFDGNTYGHHWQGTANASASDTVLTASLANRYGSYAANFANNVWWPLQPGSNDIRLLNTAFAAGSTVTINWRDAWE